MSGFGVVCLVATFCVFIAGLFAVIVDRTNERDEARAEADRLERELEARLTDPSTATTQRVPWLRVVRETDDDYWAGVMRASDDMR